MHINPPKVFEFTVSNQTYAVTMSIILQWIIMAVIIVLVLLLTRNLGKIPSKGRRLLR